MASMVQYTYGANRNDQGKPLSLADEQLLQRAFAAFQSGSYEDAERGFVKFLRRNPRHFGALNLYGLLLITRQKHDEAEAIIRRAINVNPHSDTTFYNYGIVLKTLKRPLEAFEAFSRAIEINSTIPETWSNR